MSEKPISDLRCRMLEDMAVRKFGEKTRHDYIRHVAMFAKFLDRSPDTATADDVHRYQVHLTREWRAAADAEQLGLSAALLLRLHAGPRRTPRHLTRVHHPRKLPRVLSPEEVGRVLEAAPGPGLK